MKLIWSERALQDLKKIGAFISGDSPQAARTHLQKLVDRTKQISQFPHAGRMVPEFQNENLRELIEGTYRIVYEIDDTQKTKAHILTIFESHQLIPITPKTSNPQR